MDRAWQRMLSGRRLDLLDPSPFDVELDDIAHGLSRVARWNGQTVGAHPFSVAQHSILVLDLYRASHPTAGAAEQLYCLLHDAAEYVIGDLISPFKAAVGLDYKALERRLEAAIHLRFGLPAQPDDGLRRAIKAADIEAAYWEATLLAGFDETEAALYFGKRPAAQGPELIARDASQAKADFVDRFEALLEQV